jgi:hypothetical protein
MVVAATTTAPPERERNREREIEREKEWKIERERGKERERKSKIREREKERKSEREREQKRERERERERENNNKVSDSKQGVQQMILLMQMVALEQDWQTETGCDGMKATINYYYYATSYYNTTINNKMNNITYLLETMHRHEIGASSPSLTTHLFLLAEGQHLCAWIATLGHGLIAVADLVLATSCVRCFCFCVVSWQPVFRSSFS